MPLNAVDAGASFRKYLESADYPTHPDGVARCQSFIQACRELALFAGARVRTLEGAEVELKGSLLRYERETAVNWLREMSPQAVETVLNVPALRMLSGRSAHPEGC